MKPTSSTAARFALMASLAVLLAACGGAEGRDNAKAGDAAAHAEANTPFAAIAAGKVDIEGGLVDVAARQPGIVREVLVQEGDQVRKDQVLARLDDEQARLDRDRAAAQLRQAEAQVPLMQVALDAAQRDLHRTETLNAQNFVSPQRVEAARDAVRNAQSELDAASAAVGVARAQLAEANYVVEQHVVRAPDNGRIVRRYANPGMGASTLNVTPMFQLQPNSQHIVRAEVEERSLGAIQAGMAVQIVPEADQTKTYSGSVLRIAQVFGARRLQSDDPSQQTDERVVEVVVDAKDAPVLVGQRVLVKFLRAGATAPAPAAG
ncbi:MAG TPA: efflux RND transporter periplasmic adaptor subunit [Caulobacterales bacterium]|nr:efflux RND transporter periplasmic adaptor subunit [Caulobacterales bacterium]